MNFYNMSIYLTLYAYLLINFIFIFVLITMCGGFKFITFNDIIQSTQLTYFKYIFIFLLMTFLGTPPTLGFFYKILLFQTLISVNTFITVISLLLNLILMILYLQVIRYIQISKKLTKITILGTNSTSIIFFIYSLILLVSLCPL